MHGPCAARTKSSSHMEHHQDHSNPKSLLAFLLLPPRDHLLNLVSPRHLALVSLLTPFMHPSEKAGTVVTALLQDVIVQPLIPWGLLIAFSLSFCAPSVLKGSLVSPSFTCLIEQIHMPWTLSMLHGCLLLAFSFVNNTFVNAKLVETIT